MENDADIVEMYVTFGHGHYHEIDGISFDHNTVAMIRATDFGEARQRAFDLFGPKFAFTYDRGSMIDNGTIKMFPRGIYEILPEPDESIRQRVTRYAEECYHCQHKRFVPGNAHIKCAMPYNGMKGDPHGIDNGWFIYPLLFDPIWRRAECPNYLPKGEKAPTKLARVRRIEDEES